MSHHSTAAGPSQRSLLDVDDAVLVNVFGRLDPLPHLFSVCRVCKRFKRLAGDGRLWLEVAGVGLVKSGAAGHRRLSYPTLRAAVVASRPGDTISIAPGFVHPVQDVAVGWPLRLIGGGRTAEDTSLYCSVGAEFAIKFCASGILANLSVRSEQSACIVHRRGTLVIDSCLLHSTPAPGLEHLYTPLITLASSPDARSRAGSKKRRWNEFLSSKTVKASPTPFDGVLEVRETKIRGGEGMRAVQASGTGSVARVRIINFSSDTLFWFEVNSAASRRYTEEPGQSPGPSLNQEDLPAWARIGKPLFPEQELQEAIQLAKESEDTSSHTADGVRDGWGENVNLALKSKAWTRPSLTDT